MNFSELIDNLRERPALYIGRASLTLLRSFLDGFFITNNASEFDDFNDFVGIYYGKYTTAGWHALILADHYGNEEEALRQFFVLYDAYVKNKKPINSREILYKLLYKILIVIRGQSYEKENPNSIWQFSHLVHNLPLQLYNASKSNIQPQYDSILEEILERANQDKGLKMFLFNNFPNLQPCLYEIWRDPNTSLTLLRNSLQKDMVLPKEASLIHTFFALTFEKAKSIYDEGRDLYIAPQ